MARMPHPAIHKWNSKQRRAASKAYHWAKVFAAVRVLHELLHVARWVAPGTYEIPPSLVSRARAVDADAWPYALADEDGVQL